MYILIFFTKNKFARFSQVACWIVYYYTIFTIFSMKYLVMCNVYTDVGGMKWLYHVCPPVRKIIHSLKLADYLHVQADNPWYNYYLAGSWREGFLWNEHIINNR